jgi:serine/threonine protein kinase
MSVQIRFAALLITWVGLIVAISLSLSLSLSLSHADTLAPEMILGKGHGFEADWWSLGALLWDMVRLVSLSLSLYLSLSLSNYICQLIAFLL